ncbi:hypothetical protein RQP46_010647 [Phenoliferia psychrophenolica]
MTGCAMSHPLTTRLAKMSAAGGAPRGGGRGGKRGGGGKQKFGGNGKYKPQRPVGGPGIFITCIRGKEGRCVMELYDLLDETANRIYPAERLAELEKTRLVRAPVESDPTEPALDDEPEPEPEDEPEVEEEDDSIEAQIARELKEMADTKAGTVNARRKARKAGGEQVKTVRPRFESLETATDCLIFMSVAWPYDPVELVEAIVMEVQETGISRTRFARRFEPVTLTCGSLSTEALARLSTALVEKTFTEWAVANNKTEVTYQIDPSLRSHVDPLSRSLLIDILGTSVRSLSLPPPSTSSLPTRPTLSVSANLTTPDLVLLPTVLRNCYCLSIVQGKLWSGKMGRKFNIDAIAEETLQTNPLVPSLYPITTNALA